MVDSSSALLLEEANRISEQLDNALWAKDMALSKVRERDQMQERWERAKIHDKMNKLPRDPARLYDELRKERDNTMHAKMKCRKAELECKALRKQLNDVNALLDDRTLDRDELRAENARLEKRIDEFAALKRQLEKAHARQIKEQADENRQLVLSVRAQGEEALEKQRKDFEGRIRALDAANKELLAEVGKVKRRYAEPRIRYVEKYDM